MTGDRRDARAGNGEGNSYGNDKSKTPAGCQRYEKQQEKQQILRPR
jgi:hypothetical protein